MGLYLVERYVPSVDRSTLRAATERLDDLSDDDVPHVATVIVTAEETCLSLIEAPDTAAVESLNQRAGFPFDRIVEVAGLR
ncbi:MAG TPA: nickel-binding protein [Actinomycetota bacterium]|nr:nickel-binding protein [Actinomycetota bacterium]